MGHDTAAIDEVRREVGDAVVAPDVDGPFLSVVLRTRGRRPGTLRDALVCLAAQSDADFELIVVVHTDELATTTPVVRDLVDDEATSFIDRVRVIECAGGTLARPLNVGVEHARGQYVAFFDDDDLVLANWVEQFHDGARRAPGRVVRAVVVDQPCTEEAFVDGEVGLIASGAVAFNYPSYFSVLEHTLGGTTPFHAFAFPSTTFTALQLRFTEAMAVHEDWELQTRAIQYLGVESVNAVTAIYRRHHGGDTLATHPSAIRDVLFADLVREQLANQVFLVDGEELLNFRDRTKQAEEIWRQKNDVIALLDRTMEVNAELREELRQLRSVGGVLVRARDKVKRKVRGAFRRVGIGRR